MEWLLLVTLIAGRNTWPYKAPGSPVGNSVGWRVGEGQEGAALDVSFANLFPELTS